MEIILIIGGSGYLGTKLKKTLRDNLSSHEFTIMSTYNTHSSGDDVKMNLFDAMDVQHVLNEYKPNTIIHLSAYRDIEFCEDNRKKAIGLNVHALLPILTYCNKNGTKLIYTSTNYVFSETEPTNKVDSTRKPQTLYGMTKKDAEDMIMKQINNYVIIRLSKIYGFNGNEIDSFSNKIIQHIYNEDDYTLYLNCQTIRYPILINDVCDLIKDVVSGIYPCKGIIHLCGKDSVTKYSWARKISRIIGKKPRRMFYGDRCDSDNRPIEIHMEMDGIDKRYVHGIDSGIRIMISEMKKNGLLF